MSAAIIVTASVSVLAFVAVSFVVYFSVPRSITLLLTSDSYMDQTVTVEIGRRMSNGRFDYDRGDRKKISFRGRAREVVFDGLVPGAWYRVETTSKSNETRAMMKTGSCVEIQLDSVCRIHA